MYLKITIITNCEFENYYLLIACLKITMITTCVLENQSTLSTENSVRQSLVTRGTAEGLHNEFKVSGLVAM